METINLVRTKIERRLKGLVFIMGILLVAFIAFQPSFVSAQSADDLVNGLSANCTRSTNRVCSQDELRNIELATQICRTGGPCSRSTRTLLNGLAPGLSNPASVPSTPANGGPPPQSSCDFSGYWGWTNIFTNWVCAGRFVVAVLMWPLVSLAAGILTITGWIFNTSVDVGIIKFGNLYEVIKPAIEAGWTLIRDFANIGIIGIFTYVAISMIIGNTTFGTKQMVAKVLIVAVLINFSLIFTKIIIDVSHFVAHQVYKIIDTRFAPTTSALSGATATVTGDPSPTTTGISNAFMRFSRMSSTFDSWAAIRAQQEAGRDSGFLFSFLSIIFFMASAALLLYGAIVIFARMVMLVFLILTSALAFASWLWPGFNESEYGWDGWWQKLLNNALFAPLFMILMLITLITAQTLDAGWARIGVDRGTLGGLSTSPGSNMGALTQLILVLGLFYASIRVANALSAQWASTAARTVTGGVFLGGAGKIMGGVTNWRQRANYAKVGQIDKAIEKTRLSTALTKDQKMAEIDRLTKKREKAVAASQRDYNLFNKKPVQEFMKNVAGVSGVAAGQTGGKTYEQKQKEKAKVLEERYANALPTKEETRKVIETERDKAEESARGHADYKAIATERLASQKQVENAKKKQTEAENTLVKKSQDARNNFNAEKVRIEKAASDVRDRVHATATKLETASGPEADTLRNQLEALKELERVETERARPLIEKAEEDILRTAERQIAAERATVEKAVQDAISNDNKVAASIAERQKQFVDNAVGTALKGVENSFKDYSDALESHLTSKGDAGKMAWKGIQGREKKKRDRDLFAAYRDAIDEASPETTKTPTPKK